MNYNLYAIQVLKRGPIKIGIARFPYDRMKELQTANPFSLRMIGYTSLRTESLSVARQVEAFIHNSLIPLKMRGEWFRCHDPLLKLARSHRDSFEETLINVIQQLDADMGRIAMRNQVLYRADAFAALTLDDIPRFENYTSGWPLLDYLEGCLMTIAKNAKRENNETT